MVEHLLSHPEGPLQGETVNICKKCALVLQMKILTHPDKWNFDLFGDFWVHGLPWLAGFDHEWRI